jgi:hypothetical protein
MWILSCLCERRVLTHTSDNPSVWRVELDNVGQHYSVWRYGAQNSAGGRGVHLGQVLTQQTVPEPW